MSTETNNNNDMSAMCANCGKSEEDGASLQK